MKQGSQEHTEGVAAVCNEHTWGQARCWAEGVSFELTGSNVVNWINAYLLQRRKVVFNLTEGNQAQPLANDAA